jgi:hypothetical protein
MAISYLQVLNILSNEHIIIIIQNHVALVIKKIVRVSRFGIQNIGKKLKIKSLAHQLGSSCFGFSFHIQFRQNSVIFPQFVIDIAHIIRTILIYFVVVGISATIATEFLVFATYNGISTFEAVFHNFTFKAIIYKSI